MTRDQLLEKSLGDLREIAKLQGVKSITKYRKGELVDIIMNGGSKLSAVKPKAEAEEKAGAVSAPSAPQRTEEAPDLEVDVTTLAQLMMGYADLKTLAMRKDVTIHGNRETLSAVFTRKERYFSDYF